MSFDPRVMGARCDDCPLQGFKPVPPEGPEDAAIVFVGEAPGKFEVMKGRPFCFTGDTLVLDAELRWRPITSFKIGDKIIAFDETPPRVQQRSGAVTDYRERRLKFAYVTATQQRRAPCVFVAFDDGGWLTGTPDHEILNGANIVGLSKRWRTLGGLVYGPIRQSAAVSLGTWKQGETFDHGWLGGFFDGEGHVAGSKTHYAKGRGYVGFSQNLGPTYDRAVTLLNKFGFELRQRDEGRAKGVVCGRVFIRGGIGETMRFLGTTRPERLIKHFLSVLEERGGIGMKSLRHPRVIRRDNAGEHDVYNLTTTAGTYFANGYAVHNCGASGVKLDELLYKVGLRRAEVRVTNALLCRAEVPDEMGKAKYDVKKYVAWIRAENVRRKKAKHELLENPFDCCWPRLRREVFTADRHAWRRGAPNGAVVVPLGNFALKQLAGVTGIMKYRGSVLQVETPVLEEALERPGGVK